MLVNIIEEHEGESCIPLLTTVAFGFALLHVCELKQA